LPPHEIQIDLGTVYEITGFSYLPRQDGWTHGNINAYEFYVSTDGLTWNAPTASGNFSTGALAKQVSSTAKVGRFVRLRALSEVEGQAWTSIAELNVLGRITTGTNTTIVTSTTTTASTTSTTSSTSTTSTTTVTSTTTTTQATTDDPVNWSQLVANAKGTVRYVGSKDEFNNASSTATPGDVIIVRNGTYSGWFGLNVVSNGTAAAPIIYMAETSGRVTFTGASQVMTVLGNYNIIGGFVFDGITERALNLTGSTGAGTTGASDNRITDITMRNSGKARTYWMFEISRRANRNRIDHSVFDQNYGFIRLMVAEQDSVDYGPSQDTRIDHNVFKNTRGDNDAGDRVPVLQVGQGSPSQLGSDLLDVRLIFEYNTVENHVTYYTNGLVSVKTSGNTIRYNKFINSHGSIGLRDGNYNKVYGNLISGMAGADGGLAAIDMLGAYNQVYDNIIDTPDRQAAIYMVRWGDRVCPSSPSWCTSYPATHDNLVAHNTILNFKNYGIQLGDCDNGACNLIDRLTIANNIIAGSAGTIFYYVEGSTSNLKISNNLYYNKSTAAFGKGYNYDAAPITGNPMITDPTTLPAGSIAVDTGTTIVGITEDFNHSARLVGSLPDIGAVEYKP